MSLKSGNEVHKMEDYLVKALAHNGFVRAYAVQATNTVAEAQSVMIHGILHLPH